VVIALSGAGTGWTQAVAWLLDSGLEVAVLLLSFTLAIFVVLVFAVRALMIARKLPVPTDPTDMARPRGLRALMLGSAGLLAPLVAPFFLPEAGGDPQPTLLVNY
jgi:predicted secreted protein